MKEHFQTLILELELIIIPVISFGLLYLLYIWLIKRMGENNFVVKMLKRYLDRNSDGKVDGKDVPFIDTKLFTESDTEEVQQSESSKSDEKEAK